MVRILMGGALLASGSAHAAEPGDFVGRFTAPSANVEKAVSKAIEEGASQFNMLVRPVARKRLSATVKGADWLELSFSTPSLTIKTPQRPEGYTTPVDGTPTTLTAPNGNPVEVRRWIEGNTLHSKACGDDGGCLETSFALSGDTLVYTRVVTSSQLTSPVSFRIEYTRAR